MISYLLVSVASSLIVAIAVFIAMRRSTREKSSVLESETRLMARLDTVMESVGRWRDEAKTTVQDKIGELFEKTDQQSRNARIETQETLGQFRTSLEGYRTSLTQELERNRRESRESLEAVSKSLTERFQSLQASNELKLTEIRAEVEKKLAQTLESSGQAFKDVTDRLSELHVTNQRIMDFSKDLHELQNILKAPRLRGEVGEIEMERMLRECLAPEQFSMQYEIDGNRVDAVIMNPEGRLPIDSKFPLEAWRRLHGPDLAEADRNAARRDFIKAVKGHMETISTKYIRPPHTLDFAVMYIPVEGVYYELIETPELADHARKCRVFPASPMTFWALLQVTVIGFRGLRITESARRIAGLLHALTDDLSKVRKAFDTANKQVGFAKSNMEEAVGHLDRFDTKLQTANAIPIEDGKGGLIEPPHEESLEL